RQLAADPAQDIVRDVHRDQVRGRYLELLRHDLADLYLGGVAEVHENAPEARTFSRLLAGERLFELVAGDDALVDEQVAQPPASGYGRGAVGSGHGRRSRAAAL